MTTEKLYYIDSHLFDFEATVLDCRQVEKGWAVILDRTAFFPEGGGQPADTGFIGAAPVRDVQEQGGEILHFCGEALPVGAHLPCRVEREKRLVRMQNHSGEHIVSGLAHRLFGCENVGFHMGEDCMTIDFDRELSWQQLMEVETLANEAVRENLPVLCSFPEGEALEKLEYRSKLDLTENVRIVTIPGYDVCACCAPHVKRTGEIGLIHMISMQNWKGGVRIRMLCGSRAVEDLMGKQESVTAISGLLSARQEEVTAAVRRLCEELEREKARAAALGRLAAQARAEALPAGAERLVLFEELDANGLRALVNAAVAKGTGVCAAYAWDGTKFQYILGSERQDLRPLAKEMNAALKGRGGGSERMVQGSVQAGRAEIETWWKDRA